MQTSFCILCIAAFGVANFTVRSNAAVIVDDADLAPGGMFGTYILQLAQSIPEGDGWFAIGINELGNGNYAFGAIAIAEEYSLHRVPPGTAFTPQFVANDKPIATNSGGPQIGTVHFDPFESIYFGYWDDRFFSGTPDDMDNYGWIELRRDPAGLVSLGSATAIG
jgi:hypothetical protein